MQYHLNPPPQGPLARLVAGIIAAFVLIGAVMLGMVAFLVIAGLALLAGVVIWLRVAWIKRRLNRQGVNLQGDETRDNSGHVIDAEYTIVEDPGDRTDGQDKNQR
jgi:membrane protein implicated in regulation of membrane protease activity